MKSSTRKAMKQHEASKWIGLESEEMNWEQFMRFEKEALGDEPMSLSDGTGVDLNEAWCFPKDEEPNPS